MKFNTKEERNKHPQAGLIPDNYWDNKDLFNHEITDFEIALMQKSEADVRATFAAKKYANNKENKVVHFICLAYSSHNFSNDLLQDFANVLGIADTQFKELIAFHAGVMEEREEEEEEDEEDLQASADTHDGSGIEHDGSNASAGSAPVLNNKAAPVVVQAPAPAAATAEHSTTATDTTAANTAAAAATTPAAAPAEHSATATDATAASTAAAAATTPAAATTEHSATATDTTAANTAAAAATAQPATSDASLTTAPAATDPLQTAAADASAAKPADTATAADTTGAQIIAAANNIDSKATAASAPAAAPAPAPAAATSTSTSDSTPHAAPAAAAAAAVTVEANGKKLTIEEMLAVKGSKQLEQTLAKIKFSEHLEIVKVKSQEYKEYSGKDYKDAHDAATNLYIELVVAQYNLYTAAPADDNRKHLEAFVAHCDASIKKAEKVLEKHRGWAEVLAQFLSAIVSVATLGLANIITGRSMFGLFPVRTDGKAKLDDLKKEIDSINPPAVANPA